MVTRLGGQMKTYLQDGDDENHLVYGVILYSNSLNVSSNNVWEWKILPDHSWSESYIMSIEFEYEGETWRFYNTHVDFGAPQYLTQQVNWNHAIVVGDMNMTVYPKTDGPQSIVDVFHGISVRSIGCQPTHANTLKNCRSYPNRVRDKFDHILITPEIDVIHSLETCPVGKFN